MTAKIAGPRGLCRAALGLYLGPMTTRIHIGDTVRDEYGIGVVTYVSTRSVGVEYPDWQRSVVVGTHGYDRLVVEASA